MGTRKPRTPGRSNIRPTGRTHPEQKTGGIHMCLPHGARRFAQHTVLRLEPARQRTEVGTVFIVPVVCVPCARYMRRVVVLWVGFDASWLLRVFVGSPKNTRGTSSASRVVLPSVESARPYALHGARRFCTRVIYSSLFMSTICDSSPDLDVHDQFPCLAFVRFAEG